MNERFFNVTTDYRAWVDDISQSLTDLNKTIPGSCHEPIWLGCFKSCDFYMTLPVALLEHKSISAKSRLVEDDQEVIDFIKQNPSNVVPYMYFQDGNRKVFRFAEIEDTDI